MKNFHDFTVESITGKPFDLARFKGKKVMVVNTASECGFTHQYAQLEELYEHFHDADFEIIAFPANDFGAQEPGTNDEINRFCQRNYGVSFPLMAKVTVKGSNTHPLFQWLTQKSQNGVADIEITWNFQKFLIDENGQLVKSVAPAVSPMDDVVLKWIED
jgi:glutathione peroxidase